MSGIFGWHRRYNEDIFSFTILTTIASYSIVIQVLKRYTDADMAQSVERRIGSAEVTGSIPVISFIVNTA